MEFPKTVIARAARHPPDFAADIQHIEFREDPLTGRRSRLNARRAERIKQRPPGPVPPEVIGSREACPFCPENVDQAVARFEPGFCPAGWIRRGECCLFPNMYPLAAHHAAATLCNEHFLDLDQISARMVGDSLAAARSASAFAVSAAFSSGLSLGLSTMRRAFTSRTPGSELPSRSSSAL